MKKNTTANDTTFASPSHNRKFWFSILSAAALLSACDDDSSKNKQDTPSNSVECTSNSHCADRQDNKTECDLINNVCVQPGNHSCGDGNLDAGESCDTNELNGKTCQSYNEYIGGTLKCNAVCEFDKSNCYECTETDMTKCGQDQICTNGHCVEKGHIISCGDGLPEGDEECDGSNLNDKSCADVDSSYIGGTLKCSDCIFDTSDCYKCTETPDSCGEGKFCQNGSCADIPKKCGDDHRDDGESCDKSDLDDKSCTSFPDFVGGTLKCNASCEFDKSSCVACTQTNLDNCQADEVCSESGQCVPKGHTVTCGDAIVEAPEECDGEKLNDKTCADFGFKDGVLSCVNCKFDKSRCVECSKDEHCADNTDGKTQCKSNTCVKPEHVDIQSDVVISQIYPGGGNSGGESTPGSIYKTKYVELFNRGSNPVDISNWSIQYGAAGNQSIASVCEIPANTEPLPPGGYYLVAFKSGSTGADLLPADLTCNTINTSAKNGKIILVNSTNKLSTSSPVSGYMDAIGYGSTNWAEGNAPAPELSNTTAALRHRGGCDDTNNNAADFGVGTPQPRNTSSPLHDCSAAIEPENTLETCSDRIDNDGDDNIDCDDSDCAAFCNTPENTLEACSYHIDNDGDHNTDCDDSDCAAFCNTCGDNQTYIAKYDVCAYNISSKTDLVNLRDTWNTNGSEGYAVEDGKPLVFVLTNSIGLGVQSDWTPIGTQLKPFNAVFVGNHNEIKATIVCPDDSDVCGLFGYVNNAVFEELTIDGGITTGKSAEKTGVLFAEAHNVQMNNITIKSSLTDSNAPTHWTNHAGLLGGLAKGELTLNNITIANTASIITDADDVGGLIGRLDCEGQCIISGIDVNASISVNQYNGNAFNTLNVAGAIGLSSGGELQIHDALINTAIAYSLTDDTKRGQTSEKNKKLYYIAGLVANRTDLSTFNNIAISAEFSITGSLSKNTSNAVDMSDNFYMGGLGGMLKQATISDVRMSIPTLKLDASSETRYYYIRSVYTNYKFCDCAGYSSDDHCCDLHYRAWSDSDFYYKSSEDLSSCKSGSYSSNWPYNRYYYTCNANFYSVGNDKLIYWFGGIVSIGDNLNIDNIEVTFDGYYGNNNIFSTSLPCGSTSYSSSETTLKNFSCRGDSYGHIHSIASTLDNSEVKNIRTINTSTDQFTHSLAYQINKSTLANIDTHINASNLDAKIVESVLINIFLNSHSDDIIRNDSESSILTRIVSNDNITSLVNAIATLSYEDLVPHSSAEETKDLLNNSLSTKMLDFPQGKYKPWIVNDSDEPTLNIDATEADMYTIP